MTFDPNNPTASGLVLTFDDEFNKVSWSDNNVANNTLWTDHGINPGAPNGIADIRANNLSVHDGYLDIAATRDGNGNWTTGMLASVNSSVQGFTQKFGYFEADIQIPHGAGSWPAWWLYSADHFTNGAPPSELDIMENAGSDTTNWGTTIHDGLGNQNGNVVQNAGVDLSQAFHRYGMLWDPNASTITWYLDGKAITSAQKYATTDVQHMMMTLNEEVGDFGGGGPNGSTPATMHMLVDYVRVYQFAGQGGTAVQPDTVSPAPGNNDPVAHVDALGQSGSSAGVTPSPSPAATPSADGSSLTPGASGSLVTSDGTWSFSTSTAGGGNLILLNGSQATDGAAAKLVVESGHVFADNAQGSWYEWTNSNWSASADPTAHPSTGSSGASADGSTLIPATTGSLVTSDGTWTFGTGTAGGGNVILLNGHPATDGAAAKLVVESGHVFADNAQGNWYEWTNSNWSASADPTAHPSTGSSGLSADGSTLIPGTSGSLATSDGTWTFGTGTAGGGNVILLNGHPATNGAAAQLLVESGHVFADNAQGNWYEWTNSNWSTTTNPTPPQSGATTPAPVTPTLLSPSFSDGQGHDIFVFKATAPTGAEIANFSASQDILDLAPVLSAAGYKGSDPIADHVVTLVQSGTDATAVKFDPTGADPSHGSTLVTLDHVLPQDVHAANVWH